MSESIHDVRIAALLPGSVSWDEDSVRIMDAVDPEFKAVLAAIRDKLPNIKNIDNLSGRVVDLLAWEYHLDYSPRSGLMADKRQLIRSSLAEHKRHGTRYAVRSLCDEFFGEGNYTLQEWFEYAGQPFWFRITFTDSIADWPDFLARLNVVKNVRSWADLQMINNGAVPCNIGAGSMQGWIMTVTEGVS